MTDKNEAIIRHGLIKREDAIRVAVNFTPLSKNRELTIRWDVKNDKLMQEALRYLDDYGSSSGEKGQTWVKDPIASNEVYPGIWRVSANRMSGKNEPPGVYQILREGLLRELPATEDVDTEARLMRDVVDPQSGHRTVVRFWQGVDPSYEQAMLIGRRAVKTRTNITVRSQTYKGTFAVSEVHAENSDDGSVIIVETLTEIASVSSLADIAVEVPVKTQDDEILRLFDFQTGRGDSFAFVFTNINPNSKNYLVQMSDASLVSMLSGSGIAAWVGSTSYTKDNLVSINGFNYVCLIAHISGTFAVDLANGLWELTGCQDLTIWTTSLDYVIGDLVINAGINYVCNTAHTASAAFLTDIAKWTVFGTWSYADRKFQEQKDNTANFTVLLRKVAFNAWADVKGNPVTLAKNSANTTEESISKQWELVNKADIVTALNDLNAVTAPDAPTAWVTSTAYSPYQLVSQGGSSYVCVVAHTSGTFATDLAAVKWVLITLNVATDYRPEGITATDNHDGSIGLHQRQDKVIYTYDSYSFISRYGTHYVLWGHNATIAQFNAALSVAFGGYPITVYTTNHVSRTKLKYVIPEQLYDYTITVSPHGWVTTDIIDTTGTQYVLRDEFAMIWSLGANRSVRTRRVVKTKIITHVFALYSDAQNFITVLGGSAGWVAGSTPNVRNEGSYAAMKNGQPVAYLHLVSRGSNVSTSGGSELTNLGNSYNDYRWEDALYLIGGTKGADERFETEA